MICNGLQGLNKSKLIYISVGTGLLINLCLDIPLILLFHKINIYPYYGATTATLIGYLISLIIPLIILKKKYHMNYKNTLSKIPKLLISYIIIILISLVYSSIINIVERRLLLIILIGLYGITILLLYYYLNMREINEITENKLLKLFKRKKRD